MDRGKLTEWFGLLTNIGVVIGLGILIYEVSLSTKLAEVEAHMGRLNQMQQAQLEFASSDYLPPITVKLNSDGLESLSPVELERLRWWENSVKLRMTSQYFQYQRGLLDQESADNVVAGAVARLGLWRELGLDAIPGPVVGHEYSRGPCQLVQLMMVARHLGRDVLRDCEGDAGVSRTDTLSRSRRRQARRPARTQDR